MNIIEHNKNGLVYLTADGFEAAGGVAHGFSTRLGGVSEGIYATLNLGMNRGDAPDRVTENYRRFCAPLGRTWGTLSAPARFTVTRCAPSPRRIWASAWTSRSLAGGWPCHRHPRCDAGGLLRRLPAHPAL